MLLKILQSLLRKHHCFSVFLINLQAYRHAFLLKKILQHRCFLEKFLRTAFFVEYLTAHYIFSKFFVMVDFFDIIGYKIDIFHMSHCFDFLHAPWLFRPYFHTKSFRKCKFRTHYNVGSSTILIESLKFRSNSQIAVSFPSNFVTFPSNFPSEFSWKLWLWVF